MTFLGLKNGGKTERRGKREQRGKRINKGSGRSNSRQGEQKIGSQRREWHLKWIEKVQEMRNTAIPNKTQRMKRNRMR